MVRSVSADVRRTTRIGMHTPASVARISGAANAVSITSSAAAAFRTRAAAIDTCAARGRAGARLRDQRRAGQDPVRRPGARRGGRPDAAHLPTVERVVALGGPTDEYETWTDAHEPDPEIHPSAPDDCFVQLYTSGTTGFPKGAMLTHRGTLAHSRDLGLEALMDDDGRVQVAMPLFHVGGTSFALFAMANGAHAMVLRAPEPTAVLDMLERERITHTFLVPALLAAASQMPGAAERDFSALRMLVYGASPMPLPVMRACLSLFPGVMRQAYGMTEVGGVASMLGPADHEDPAVARRLVSAGRPIAGVEIEIRDPDTGVLVPTGASGEIWVRIDQLMDGYWSNPKATAEVVTPDGWLRSRRRWSPRRRRLRLRHRPDQGHDRLGRRERLPGRDRANPRRTPRSRRRRRDRGPRRAQGRGPEGAGSGRRGAAGRHRGTLDRAAGYEQATEALATVVMRLPGWDAALDEVKGQIALARGSNAAAVAHFHAAAEGFRDAGQPLEEARCATSARRRRGAAR